MRAAWWPAAGLVPDALQLLGVERPAPADASRLQAALLVLAALPEAALSREISVHPARRTEAAAALASSAAVAPVVKVALGAAAPLPCQLAALRLLQSWGALPGAAAALLLPPAIVEALHQAVLSPPGVAAEAAEAVAALYAACSPADDPAARALLGLLVPRLQPTVGPALQAAAAGVPHAAQLLNAALVILAAAAPALLAQVGGAAAGGGSSSGRGSTGCPAQAQETWEALGVVAGTLLELLGHPDPEISVASLQPWDEALLPGLEQLARQQQGWQDAERARQLLAALCAAIVRRMCLPAGLSSAHATADARELPEGIRAVSEAAGRG